MRGMQTHGSETFKNCFFKDNIKQRYNFNISLLLLLQNYFLKFSNPIDQFHRYFKIYYYKSTRDISKYSIRFTSF